MDKRESGSTRGGSDNGDDAGSGSGDVVVEEEARPEVSI
jgi:hypothetical protein